MISREVNEISGNDAGWKCTNRAELNQEYVKENGTIRFLSLNVYSRNEMAITMSYDPNDINYDNIKILLEESGYINKQENKSSKNLWSIKIADVKSAHEVINIIELYEPLEEKRNQISTFLNKRLKPLQPSTTEFPDSYQTMFTTFAEQGHELDSANNNTKSEKKELTLEEYQDQILRLPKGTKEKKSIDKVNEYFLNEVDYSSSNEEKGYTADTYDEAEAMARAIRESVRDQGYDSEEEQPDERKTYKR